MSSRTGRTAGKYRNRPGRVRAAVHAPGEVTIDDIRREFERYCSLVSASDRKPSTKATYIQHADRFVRWLAGEIDI